LITSAGGPNRIAIIPLPQLLYLHRAKTTAISPILRWTVALIQANLLAIAVIVAALTMAFTAVLKPRQTISRHIAGCDNAESNADFCYPIALHTPISSFKCPPLARIPWIVFRFLIYADGCDFYFCLGG
jgi:hypothetical protein